MKALNLKLLRDLWRLRGQVLAVGMVIASGVATLVMSTSTIEALNETTQAYYERYRFGDIFASATRVPETLVPRIAQLPGVQTVETRITHHATVDVEGFIEPIIAQLTSVPESRQPNINQLVLRQGRWVTPNQHDEVIINEPFAESHKLSPGQYLSVIMNGHKRRLKIVGIALSPEFIYALGPGSLMPDSKRYGIFWMGHKALAAAYDLDSAFNNVSLSIQHGAQHEPIMRRLDSLLERYGGTKAVARDRQLSNWFVMSEIDQLKTTATIMPTIFLAVAAFLTHMVLARLIATEREEIGLLKAFGYSNLTIGWHYTKFILVLGLLGISVGSLLGTLIGRQMTEMYAELFRFPLLIYRPSPTTFLVAASISLLAALAGCLGAVRQAVKLPPAEAMNPPAPTVYRHGLLANSALSRWFDQPTRITLRQIGRRPVKALLTSMGVSFSIALLVLIMQWNDAIDHIVQSHFFDMQKQDVTVGLAEKEALRSLQDFKRMPSVLHAEASRAVSATFRVAAVEHREAITGVLPQNQLQPIFDEKTGDTVTVPSDGLVLSTSLADKLRVKPGDSVWVEVMEGRRPSGWLPVVSVFDTLIAMPAYMDFRALNRFLKEAPSLQYVNLLIDESKQNELFAYLKELPSVSGVVLRQTPLDAFNDTLAKNMLFFISIFTILASALAFGVTYNSTRIALSERGRELATLRVLGFTQGEISYILLAEVILIIFLSLPMGCLFGWLLALLMASAFDTELFRIPTVIRPSTFGWSMIVILIATACSAALVRQRVNKLDLIRVLKTRE